MDPSEPTFPGPAGGRSGLLRARRSVPSRLLGAPGPDEAQLWDILAEAVRVPDHGRLAPWRFLLVRGDARDRLGSLLAQRRLELEPDASEAVVAKDRQRFGHAPLVVVVVARLDPEHRIPVQEQLLSGGCVCFSLLLAAHERGFGAQWLTGWAAYDREVAARLGLADNEQVLGFIHVGTAAEPGPDRPRPDPRELASDWNG